MLKLKLFLIAVVASLSTQLHAQIGDGFGDTIDHLGTPREATIKEFNNLKIAIDELKSLIYSEGVEAQSSLSNAQIFESDIDRVVSVLRQIPSNGYNLLLSQVEAQNSRADLTLAIREERINARPAIRSVVTKIHETATSAFMLLVNFRQSLPNDGTLRGAIICKARGTTAGGFFGFFNSLGFTHYDAYQ
ncbi:MAG: hypothetical protein NT027_17265 [Proteobacteria bacterium]|nr:hypothetical protein [Pseudomonadota bacterium]